MDAMAGEVRRRASSSWRGRVDPRLLGPSSAGRRRRSRYPSLADTRGWVAAP
jgi:hypothetical protein